MLNTIQTIYNTRSYLLNFFKELPNGQLNSIPIGFNNNIIWNVGHLVAAQQGICYTRCGLKPVVNEKYLIPFRPGTRPEGLVEQDEVKVIYDLLFSSLDQLDQDHNQKAFENYTPWTTRYGVSINNIDEAISFLAFHEGLHSGIIMSMLKLVK